MFRIAIILVCLVSCFSIKHVNARMDCSLGTSKNFFSEVINSCPSPFDSSKEYCCYFSNGNSYCCNEAEFLVKTGFGIIIPAVATFGAVILLVVCCISCLCCSCCPWYKRRHRGTVYGRGQPPVVQVIHAVPNSGINYPSQPPQNPYLTSVYPVQSTAMPMPEPPPQYTSEAYAKQAPYNPNYPQ